MSKNNQQKTDLLGESNQEKITHLKGLIAEKEGRMSRDRLPSSSLVCGVPRGALVEVAGHARVEWVVSFLKENPTLKILWIENSFTLFPPALHQRGVDLDHFVFAEVGPDLFSCVRKALRSQVFECIISPSRYSEERIMKALQLLAEKANSTVILLSEDLQSSWPISLQFEVSSCRSSKNFLIHLKKNKGHSVIESPVIGTIKKASQLKVNLLDDTLEDGDSKSTQEITKNPSPKRNYFLKAAE